MKKIDFDYLSNHTYTYKYVGDGSGDWNYYLQFKRNGTYSIQQLEYELSQLPLINECEIHLEGMTWDGFVLSVIWKGNVHWYGSFKLEYHPLDLYDTDFLKYLEDKIDTESKKSTKKFRESKNTIKESVEFSKEKNIYIAQIKDSSISFAYTPIDTDDDFNGYFVFDGDDVIEYLNWKGADANDMLKAFDDFEKAVKKHSSKEDAKIIIKDFHDKLGI